MIHDRVASRLADPDQSAAACGLSRRRFLHAGAAAGGGLMLSLSLPFSAERSPRGRHGNIRAQRFHPHRQ